MNHPSSPSLALILIKILLLSLLTLATLASSQQQQQCDASNGQTCTPENDAATKPHARSQTTSSISLPDNFVDPCQNKNANCRNWAMEGECRNNPNFMFANCARTCGSCHELNGSVGAIGDGVDNRLCDDEHQECGEWARRGECSVNPRWMQGNCKYSCWKCLNIQKDRELGVAKDVTAKKVLYMKMDSGKQQMIRDPMLKEDHEKIRAILAKMDHYEKYTITDPSTNTKMRERCRNEFPMCAEWAMRGMCLNSNEPLLDDANNNRDGAFIPNDSGVQDGIFMMNVCPLACGMCEHMESFHKCTGRRHPWAQPSFQSGELNSFFEGKRGSGSDWAKYEPVFASHPNAEIGGREGDPYVVVLKNFLSDEEVDHLRSMISGIGWDLSMEDDPIQNAKYGGRARCHDTDYCDSDKIYQRIMHRISTITNSTDSHLEPMEIDHFHESKEHESPIQHNFEVSGTFKPAGPRVLSLFLFLSNTDKGDGGELGFPHLDLFIRPKKGMAVLWPNVRNDNLLEADPLTSFEHFPLRNGDRAFVGSHVHVMLHNWTDANIRGCA